MATTEFYDKLGFFCRKTLLDGKVEVERLVDGKVKMFKPDDVEPQNPPKYELLEDMANMTYLSEVKKRVKLVLKQLRPPSSTT